MRYMKSWTIAAAAAFMLAALPGTAHAGAIHKDVPEQVDPAKRYLIYLHGGWPEIRALSDPHPKNGLFEYEDILSALAERDFEVISELRREKTNPRRFARTRIIPQITSLIEKGVPANQITVVGFSKGGHMVLILSALAKQPELNFVTMAGCGAGQFRKAYESILTNDATKMQGRMLSLYDSTDAIAGTCSEAAALGTRLTMTEEALKIGSGHGSFYNPHTAWLDQISAFAAGAPKTQ